MIDKMSDPVYTLIRTSNRPKFFERCMESIKNQTYKNIVTIVHTDNDNDKYVTGDIVIKKQEPKETDIGSAPYNLYCNTLLENIPDNPGWFHFMDDDDMYAAPDVIERAVNMSKHDHVNVMRSNRGDGNIWPRYWKAQKSFQTQCFFMHTDHKNLARWWSKKAGDHYYSKQLTDKLPINWIDGLIIATAQEGKGHGKDQDLGQRPKNKKEKIPVMYLKYVKSPSELKGNIGDIKNVDQQSLKKLLKGGYIKVIDKTVYSDFISKI